MDYLNRQEESDLKQYNAIGYTRLSKDDRKGHVSDSIANQQKLIRKYVQDHPNITLVDEFVDDGYTGTNYNRPGFCAVVDAIEQGKANCVIVKDLSRMGREYIETGKYLEMVFPSMGVRFIAINDDVDSEHSNAGDDIVVPIKNIMNESYCRDLSKKLRRQFRIQRGNGEFLGAFASYGYCKSPNDKHKLVIDDYAAEVVQGIFSLKMKGHSSKAIADFLNGEGILPPAEYKKSLGLRYQSGFQRSQESKWTVVTLNRILTNPLYIGTLVQGKRGTPNYKIRKMCVREKSEWVVVEHNHPAIIDPLMFSIVQKILERDTRRSPREDNVLPLAGVVYCPDCGSALQKRSVVRGNRRYDYYVCANYKNGKGCSKHSIQRNKLEEIILHAITNQIRTIIEMDQLLQTIDAQEITNIRLSRLDALIEQKRKDLESYQAYRTRLYETLSENLIDRDEYQKMRNKYAAKINEAEVAIKRLEEQREKAKSESTLDYGFIMQFAKFQGISELTHEAVVTLVDKVYVYENQRVKIEFNYRDEVGYYQKLLKKRQKEVG